MNTKLMIAAAALFATGSVFAQTTGTPPADTTVPSTSASPAPASDPMATGPMASDPLASNPMPSGSMPNDSTMTTGTDSTHLTKGSDGKWMMGDRPATKAEIAANKKASKTRPM